MTRKGRCFTSVGQNIYSLWTSRVLLTSSSLFDASHDFARVHMRSHCVGREPSTVTVSNSRPWQAAMLMLMLMPMPCPANVPNSFCISEVLSIENHKKGGLRQTGAYRSRLLEVIRVPLCEVSLLSEPAFLHRFWLEDALRSTLRNWAL